MTKKKQDGTKAKIRAEKERERRRALGTFLAFILLVVVFSAYVTYTSLNPPQNRKINQMSFQFKAAIVDQLSLTLPNQTFAETATSMLKQAGYTVDYYPGEKVTVDFYRDLLNKGYGLLILRVHSAPFKESNETFFFTSQPYSKTQYVNEQLTDQVKIAYPQMTTQEFSSGNYPKYFAIGSEFVEATSETRLGNTTIIAMGCDGLTYPRMAEAFVEKGAKAYMGWDGSVTSEYTDRATTNLLKHLIQDKQIMQQAVENTMKEVRPDSESRSTLSYYPLEVGEQIILSVNSTC
jgi:hypothetical protein